MNDFEKEQEVLNQSTALNKLTVELLTTANRQCRCWQIAFFCLLGLEGMALLLYYFRTMGEIA